LIVIAEQTVGRGRVLFLATDTFYKWHTLASGSTGPTPYSIFWQQAFRAMTPARSSLEPVNLWLTPSRSRAEVGQRVVLYAEVQSARALPLTQVEAFVTTADEKRVPLVFTVDPANPRQFRAEFVCTKPGLQSIAAALVVDGKTLAESATSLQGEEPRGEDGDIDLTALARIAQDTGGKLIDQRCRRPGRRRVNRRCRRWNGCTRSTCGANFTLMLLLCGLLGADWFIRLFKGLVSG